MTTEFLLQTPIIYKDDEKTRKLRRWFVVL